VRITPGRRVKGLTTMGLGILQDVRNFQANSEEERGIRGGFGLVGVLDEVMKELLEKYWQVVGSGDPFA